MNEYLSAERELAKALSSLDAPAAPAVTPSLTKKSISRPVNQSYSKVLRDFLGESELRQTTALKKLNYKELCFLQAVIGSLMTAKRSERVAEIAKMMEKDGLDPMMLKEQKPRHIAL